MAKKNSKRHRALIVASGEPLIGIPFEEDGRVVVKYFCSEEEADKATAADSPEGALALAGAWADLDWDDMERELDRIRHESPPSAPISL